MAVLGDTLDKIAAEKAGIIKKGTKLVLESQEKDAMDVLPVSYTHLQAASSPKIPSPSKISVSFFVPRRLLISSQVSL